MNNDNSAVIEGNKKMFIQSRRSAELYVVLRVKSEVAVRLPGSLGCC